MVLSFGLSAGAQSDDGTPEEDAQGAEQVDGSAGVASGDDAIGEARSELERLRGEVQAADAARGKAADEKEQIADDIADTQRKLAAAKEHRGEAEREFSETASDVYKEDDLGALLGVMLGTETFENSADRLEFATRLFTKRRDVAKEANETEDKLASELQERRERLQEWETTAPEYEALEEQTRQAEADAKAYLDGLDEEVREAIEAERTRQTELDQARSEELLRELAKDKPSAITSTEDLTAAQDRAKKLAELGEVEQEAEEAVAEKVVEAEQKTEEQQDAGEATKVEQTGLNAEQAATEAAERAAAAEKARHVAERGAAAALANPQAAAKEAERQAELPIEISDEDGAVNTGDRLRVEGDFSIAPGSTVTFVDNDGTQGTAIDGFNAIVKEGSIDTEMTGPLNNVNGGDGVMDMSGELGLGGTTGIADKEFLAGPDGAPAPGGLQYDPMIGAAGLQYDPITGAAGSQPSLDQPNLGQPNLGQLNLGQPNLGQPDLGQPDLGKGQLPAASGQPGLQRSAPAGGSASGSAALGVGAGLVGMPYAFGTDGPNTFSCTGLIRYIMRSLGLPEGPWDHGAYLSQYPTVATPAPGDVVVYPDGVAMYAGDNTVLMSNHADGRVGYYPMGSIGTPLGFARPF